jgi:hypothetical protein
MMTLPRFLRIVGPSLFMISWFACGVVGQTETATVSGLVTDRTAAAVSGAEVRLQSAERGTVTTTTTNNAGIYVFPSVQPGQYQISIQKQGFKQVDLLGLIVNVQDHIEQNFRLEVGSIAESVTVEAGASMINTTNASVSTVVDQMYVKNMPLNGRSFQDLILLAPGVVTQSPQPTGNGGLGMTGEFSVNGQRLESNYYTVDGVDANVGAAAGENMILGAGISGSVAASTALGTTQALVSVDALQEFRVQSSTYSAEYGRSPGGQFSFETKSGTNQWHGTAYDYLRNGFFDAQDWFNDYLGVKEPAIRQNDFGGTLGAPIRIPGLYNGKDKTFFFVSYEGLRLISPQPAAPSFVPDLCMRGVVAQCPSGRQPAASAIQPVIQAFPLPSPNGLEDAKNGFGQFIGSWSNPSSINSTGVRFDHVLKDNFRLFFRFSDTGSSSATRGGFATVPTLDATSAYTLRTYTAGVSNLLSSRLSNDFRLNYSSNEVTQPSVIDAFGGSTSVNLAQLTGLGAGAQVGVAFRYGGYQVVLSPQQSSGAQSQWNLVDTVNLSLGRHQFKFGADYRRLAPVATLSSPAVTYSYRSEGAVETNNSRLFGEAFAPAYPLYKNFSAFAQDEWRVSPRLSLALGLRWELNPAPGVTKGLKPYTIQGAGPETWTLAPQGTPLWQTTWFNFAPRLGVAYVLHDVPGRETVVRGGGGVFFDTGQQPGSQGFFVGPGFFSSVNLRTFPFPGNPAAVIPPIVNPPGLPQRLVQGFAPHLQLPYTLQWNASIEQALGKSQALTFSYVGSHGARLLQQNNFQPSNNPNVGFFVFVQNGLTSDYNSLQVQFRRRLSRGLTVLASYTWSHCVDYGSQNYLVGYQRGNCDFDVRHNLSAAFSYDLPNMSQNGFLRAILHHWGLDDRLTVRTGFPVTLNGNESFDPVTGLGMFSGLDLVPNQPIYLYGANCASILQGLGDLRPGQGCPGERAINPNAFAAPPTDPNTGNALRLGTAPRNFARGFGAWQMNLAVRREFPLYENLKLQFRAEAFNIFNHPNFGTINPTFGTLTFGQATGTLANSLGILNPLYQTGGSRSMQFALKFIF